MKRSVYRLSSKNCQHLFLRFFLNQLSIWRRGGDSNPRWHTPHSLSRRAPSASRSPLHAHQYSIFMADGQGFEPRVGCPTLVFKTRALSHSASHPYPRQVNSLPKSFGKITNLNSKCKRILASFFRPAEKRCPEPSWVTSG